VPRLPRLLLLTLGATAAGVLAVASPAAAHVTVNPDEAPQGGYTRVAFRVPTESDTASTTKVEVNLPADAPITSVSTQPVPGWTVAMERDGKTITKITWTAGAGAAIKPGQFQEFPVSLGPLPTNVDRLVFKTLQTYSDGTVARWIEEPPAPGGAEPESPAPVLTLTKQPEVTTTAPAAPPVVKDGDSGLGPWLGALGLAAGLGGLVLGGLAFLRTRRAPTA
jgi:periplasmic copper chaperone A